LADEAKESHFVIEPLGSKHDRAAFSCGVDSLDIYLQKQAGQDLKKHAAVSFVLTPDGKTIAGYYTLSQYAVQLENVPEHFAKKLPKYPMVPTTLIGRLAVNSGFRGQGHGETLLMDALYRICQHGRELASTGAVVDAIDAAAVAFYQRYGFLELPKVPRRLFLPMGTINQLFQG
jgi:ribosomal protein S18 acetylase RimI-like enzyme